MNCKTILIKTKNTVVKHRAKFAAVATLVVMIKLLNQMAQREQLEFIESKGMLQEYFTPEA